MENDQKEPDTNFIANMTKFKYEIKSEEDKSKEKVLNQVPFDQYFKWVHDSYIKNLPVIEYKTNYNQGMLKRFFNISSMKYSVLSNITFGNTIIFKLYDIILRKEVNYATLFCEDIADLPPRLIKNLYNEQKLGNIVMQHYSVSPSFTSCDGEYRGRFTNYADFIRAKIEFPEIWNELEVFVLKLMKSRQWSISAHYFHGKENDINNDLERLIKSNLIGQSFLVLSWFQITYLGYLNTIESHINPDFREIFQTHQKIDKEFIREMIKKYGETNLERFFITTSHIVHPILGSQTVRYISIGYKMIPLNVKEIQNPLKLEFKPWREFFISNKCNDLIINQIAPGFSIILDWFLIKNSNKGLFDNQSQYERLKNSDLAKNINTLLCEAQYNTYFMTTRNNGKQWINNKFRKLNDKMQNAIDFSNEEIIMSDITLVFPSEFVGRTIIDTANLIQKSKLYDQLLGHPFSNYSSFSKYIFELCYNLLAINTKLGVIHGDLHLNNATIGFLYSSEQNYHVMYQIDKQQFIFPNNGYFIFLIDFSRALINPEDYEKMIDFGTPSNVKLLLDYDSFESSEIQNFLILYLQIFPNKLKQKDELSIVFKHNFPAVFRLLTCIDLYMYTIRLISFLSKQTFEIHKKCVSLIEKINHLSEMYLTNEMNELIKDSSYSKIILERKFPIEEIITKCFSEFNENQKNVVLNDFYSLNNNMIHSISKYDLFPEALKYSKYYSGNKTVDIQIINNIKYETRQTYEKRKLHSLEHIKFLAQKYINIGTCQI